MYSPDQGRVCEAKSRDRDDLLRGDLRRDGQSERLKSDHMNLRDLIAGVEIGEVTGPSDPDIGSIAYDSRKAEPGAIFFALRGEKLEGVEFVKGALGRGAIAVASEHPRLVDLPDEITWVQLPPGTQRRGLASASANFYGHPAEALKLVGHNWHQRENHHGVSG